MKLKNAIKGQRVVLKEDYYHLKAGDTGTIRGYGSIQSTIGVEWDKPSKHNHNCYEMCHKEHGWFVSVGNIRKLKGEVQDEAI